MCWQRKKTKITNLSEPGGGGGVCLLFFMVKGGHHHKEARGTTQRSDTKEVEGSGEAVPTRPSKKKEGTGNHFYFYLHYFTPMLFLS